MLDSLVVRIGTLKKNSIDDWQFDTNLNVTFNNILDRK